MRPSVPALIGVVIDRAVATANLRALGIWLVVLALTFAGLSISSRFGTRVSTVAAVRADRTLRLAAGLVLGPGVTRE